MRGIKTVTSRHTIISAFIAWDSGLGFSAKKNPFRVDNVLLCKAIHPAAVSSLKGFVGEKHNSSKAMSNNREIRALPFIEFPIRYSYLGLYQMLFQGQTFLRTNLEMLIARKN